VRHVRMLGLCLVAVFTVAAVSASTALAGPQWVKCEKVGPGHNYSGPNCTKSEKAKPKGSGEYELYKAPEVEAKRVAEGKSRTIPFSGHNVGIGGILTTGALNCIGGTYEAKRVTRKKCEEGGGKPEDLETASVDCEAETNTGEVVGKDEVGNIHVVFTGCKALGVIPCTSAGAASGEIRVNKLKGKLGYINKAAHEVGVLLEPAAKHGAFAEFECVVLGFVVGVGNKTEGTFYREPNGEEKHGGYDGIISPITPVNKMSSTFEQVYTTNHSEQEPQNIPSKFENQHIDVLEDHGETTKEPGEQSYTMWNAAGEEITNVNTSEEPGEILG